LFSSPESIVRGEPSWLALLETVWATLLCWGVAGYFHTHWPIALPLGIAPLLLLRSPASTTKGARWFAAYLADKTKITPLGTPIRFWAILLPLIVGVTTLFTSLLAERLLPHYSQWALFLRATAVGLVAMWIAMAIAVAGAMVGSVVVALTVAFALAVGAARAGVVELAFAWALAVTLVGMAAALIAIMWMGAVAGEGELAVAILLAGLPWIVGIWLRSLGVRLLATLCHPWQGLLAMPDNWRRIVWVLDGRHPPELVPGLSLQTRALSWVEIQTVIHSRGVMKRLFGLLAFCCFFLPAILYRWSLKSTLWLYWPLLYLQPLPRSQDRSEQEQWRITLQGGHWEHSRRWLSLLLAILASWAHYYPQFFSTTEWHILYPDLDVVAAWQGFALALVLLTLAIHGAGRAVFPLNGLIGLVWLRNLAGIIFLLWTGLLAYSLGVVS
ncbi:MAG: hypothetical protein HQL80_08845, partial [Magnetococcales bacterium]|nr:hypothetical protein [Magnetococcales bacterium]